MESMVGALAIFTIGAALLIGSRFFLRHNRDPKNYDATKRVVQDRESAATTSVSWETVDGRRFGRGSTMRRLSMIGWVLVASAR